ncbi:MAG: type IV pilus modification protein PilV [Steroidobacteraceae bacterium]
MMNTPAVSSLQRGISIVEVLVALVVLSVGMLGIAGLYVITLRSSGSAIYRTQAVALAADMADRIRANRNATTSYAGAADSSGSCEGSSAGSCSAAAMAASDLYVWRQAIASTLPGSSGLANSGGTITVAADATYTSLYLYTITVSWNDPSDATSDSSGTLTYKMSFQI